MIIKQYTTDAIESSKEIDCIEMGSGPLVYFSSDSIPDYIPANARNNLKDTFHAWRNGVHVLGQVIDEQLTVLSITMDGRPVDSIEMEYLCNKMNIPSAQVLYSGPFNEDLLQLVDQALVRQGNSNILWRRE